MWAHCKIHVGIGLGNKREKQLSSCVPIVSFRGATMTRSLGYEGRQPGCIPSVSTIPVKCLKEEVLLVGFSTYSSLKPPTTV